MSEESTQRHTGESTKPPAAHHRASSQDDTPQPQKQPGRQNAWLSRRATRTLANVLCLLVGLWYVWTTRDLLGFILLYGIATGAIKATDVVGLMIRRKGQRPEGNNPDSDDESEQDKESQL